MTVGSGRVSTGERIFAGAMGLVFATEFVLALGYPPEPRLFPLIVATAGLLFCGALLVGFGLHDRELGTSERIPAPLLTLTLAVSPAYGAALFLLGYWIATLGAVPIIAWLLGYRQKKTLAIVTAGLAVALGVIFPLLGIALPRGLLFEKLGI